MTALTKKEKFRERVAQPLVQQISEARILMGNGNALEIIHNLWKSSPLGMMKLEASLQPKNVHVKQYHRINFVEVPKKEQLPADMEENIIDISPIPNC